MKKRYGAKQDIFSDMKNGMKTPELWEKYPRLKHSYIRKLRCIFNKAAGMKTTPIISGKDNPGVVTIEEKKRIIEDDPVLSGMKELIEFGKDIFNYNSSNPTPEEKKNDVRREDVKPSPEKELEIEPKHEITPNDAEIEPVAPENPHILPLKRKTRYDPFTGKPLA